MVDQIVYSHGIGVCKPDPRAFEVTCNQLGVLPQGCLFIDDVSVYVEAAREAGMQAHLFEDNAGTIARVAERLNEAASFSV
ncbi:HAD-IA family hydrolase [Streptomyces sp. NPDC006510]|uniref:HAD-IA family hydrolase n=1 Tax=Streptomyces sp. NPDC006510 TaxID=3155600 RepID=UPI00339DD22B